MQEAPQETTHAGEADHTPAAAEHSIGAHAAAEAEVPLPAADAVQPATSEPVAADEDRSQSATDVPAANAAAAADPVPIITNEPTDAGAGTPAVATDGNDAAADAADNLEQGEQQQEQEQVQQEEKAVGVCRTSPAAAARARASNRPNRQAAATTAG